MYINLKEKYTQEVLAIWKDFQNFNFLNENGKEYRKSPLLPELIRKEAILFIGINPSFNQKSIIPEHEKKIAFYLESKENDIIYFEKFKDIARFCEEHWTHLDLLFVRETKQKEIERLSHLSEGINFISKQIDISFEIIEQASPKIIVVCNSFASELFGKKKQKHSVFDTIWKGYNLDFYKDFDENIGTYKIKLGEKETPIIFSGMLSGQRALDKGSFERLKWQIKMILNNVKS
ncbi:hypothetical protein KRX57_05470 [Weeksellaceae bacterium TAE3-ERU29]|nr:hypothetical protein [Weeksellaceae bacterium TAE3-ERU29]